MRGSVKTYAGFSGGVNRADAPFLLEESEARDARNMIGTPRGKLRKRDGAQTFASPGTQLRSLFALETPDFLIGSGGTVLYSISPAGVVTTIGTGLTTTKKWEWVQAPAQGGQGPAWGMNGVDTPKHWTGSGSVASWTASSGVLPNGKFVIIAGNRVWVAGEAANPSRLYWSDLGNPRSWPVENVNAFDEGDGEEITGLGKVGPYLLVFKPSKAWVVYDLDRGSNRPLGKGVGCVAHRSIVQGPGGTFFLTADQGVMLTDGTTVQRISDRLRPVIDDVEQASRADAAGVFFNDHYYLSLPTAGSLNDLTLDFDTRMESWWLHTVAAQQWATWAPTALLGLYAGQSGVSGRVLKAFVAGELQDAGAAFTAYWDTPYFGFGDIARAKRVRQMQVIGDGRVKVSVAKDFNPALTALGDFTLVAASTPEDSRVKTPGVGRAWSFRFWNDVATALELEAFSVGLTARPK